MHGLQPEMVKPAMNNKIDSRIISQAQILFFFTWQ
jgi:hypothetical protein